MLAPSSRLLRLQLGVNFSTFMLSPVSAAELPVHPHPSPLPDGEGERFTAWGMCTDQWLSPARRRSLPLLGVRASVLPSAWLRLRLKDQVDDLGSCSTLRSLTPHGCLGSGVTVRGIVTALDSCRSRYIMQIANDNYSHEMVAHSNACNGTWIAQHQTSPKGKIMAVRPRFAVCNGNIYKSVTLIKEPHRVDARRASSG